MSSGKVKCTCGWSWNKSDSSKKDMYICHECGRDNSNNMKNGGWLDSYADGGTMQEHQENYNNSEVSLPEGFVGMGNNTKGRNYSPAWGGQFQMGGEVYPVNYVPKAQAGRSTFQPIMPAIDFISDKLSSWFGNDEEEEAVKKPVVKNNTRTLKIVDPRKKMATTNQPLRPNVDLLTGNYSSNHLDKLMQEAKRQGLSKQDMMNLSAMGFQETKWGRSDDNIGHVLSNFKGDDYYQQFINAYKEKMKEADRLGITDPAMRLQVYNGLGTITPKTEKKYHGYEMQKIYGVPIPKGGISMKKNPLYGKQVIDVRDNVLAENPEYVQYLDSIYKAPVPGYMEEVNKNKQKVPALIHDGNSGSFPKTKGFAPILDKHQMGGSIPGAVGFSYARTNDPAPDNGPGAKKTMASAKDGAWLDQYDVAQAGKKVKFDPKKFEKFMKDQKANTSWQNKSSIKEAQDEERRRMYDTKEYQDWVKAKKKAIVQDRKTRIKNSVDAQDKPFTKDNWRQQLADETQATGDKFRLFPDDPDSFIDDYINPGVFIGNMASSLGSAPLRAQQEDSYMPYVTSVGLPVGLGAAEALIPKLLKSKKSAAANSEILPPKQILVDEQYFQPTDIRNAINDVKATTIPSNTEINLLREAIDSGEMWKYPGINPKEELIRLRNAAKTEVDVAYINALEKQYEKGLGNQWSEIARRRDNPVFLTGQTIEELELAAKANPEGNQWASMTEYKSAPTKGDNLGFVGDIDDYIHDPKYMLPGKRFDEQALIRDWQRDAGDVFNRSFKDKNWKPNINDIPLNKTGGTVKSDRGQWDYPGQVTEIDQSEPGSYIDMGPDPKTGKPITQNVLAISDTGDVKLMMPGGKYKLKGTKVTEYPVAEEGIETTTTETTIPKKIDIREVPRGVVSDNIPNASKMAIKQDEKFLKALQFKKEKDAKALKEWNALTKDEQERIIYNEQSKKTGTISEYIPDSKLSKFAQSMVTPFTALKDLYQKGEVRDNLLASVAEDPKNNMNPLDAAYLATFGRAAAPYVPQAVSAASPYMTADAVVGGTTLTGLNLNNLITAGFATHGAMNIVPNTEEWLDNPSWEKAGEIGMNTLELAPLVGPVTKTISEGYNAVKESDAFQGLFNAKNAKEDIAKKIYDLGIKRMELEQGPITKTYRQQMEALDEEMGRLQLIRNKMAWRSNYNKGGYGSYAVEDALISIKQANIDKSKTFELTKEGLYQSKIDSPLGFKQGSSEIIDLETGEMFPISVKGSGVEAVQQLDSEGNVIKNVMNTSDPVMNEDYLRVLNRNIEYIEKNIPGAKVYGSTRTAGELGVPHITGDVAAGDYDIYMTQSNYEKHFGKKSSADYSYAQSHSAPGEHGGNLKMEVNVIAQDVNGKATGERALELFRQWEPDEFFNASKEAMKRGKDAKIEIPYTPQELIDKVDPTVKTVVDAYEAYKNPKNINKIDGIINYGNPDIVIQGQEKFIKGLVGNRGNLGHQFDPSQFADVAENNKLLKDIGFIGNLDRVAKDPKRMQIALNDYYINNSVLARHVNDIPLDKLELYESALGTYAPEIENVGMSANGIGQNNVQLGTPNHLSIGGNKDYVIGVKQYGLNLDTTNPKSYVDSIKHTTSGSKIFTQEERDILNEITQKYKDKIEGFSPEHSINTNQLVHNLPKSEEAKKLMYEFAERTNRRFNVQEGNIYSGGSTYVSALSDFDEAIDAMTYTYANQYDFDKALKSFSLRTQNSKMNSSQKINALAEELTPKEFKQIEGYLKGGMEKAEKRIAELKLQIEEILKEKKVSKRRMADKKLGGLPSKAEAEYKEMQDELNTMGDIRYELVKKMDRIREFNRIKKEVAKATVIGTTIGGAIATGAIGLQKMAENKVEAAKNDELRLKEDYKNLSPSEQSRLKYKYDWEIYRLKQIQEDPSIMNVMKSGMKKMDVKQSGGKITKAKDGNQLVKLDQLTNFTNYNTKQPGGWLDTL